MTCMYMSCADQQSVENAGKRVKMCWLGWGRDTEQDGCHPVAIKEFSLVLAFIMHIQSGTRAKFAFVTF